MRNKPALARAVILLGLGALAVLSAGEIVNQCVKFATETRPGHRWVALVAGYRFVPLIRTPPAYRSPIEAVYAAGTASEGSLFVEFYPRGTGGPGTGGQLTVWRSRTPDAPDRVAQRLRRVFRRGFEETRGWPPQDGSCVGGLWARIDSTADPQARLLCQRIPGSTEGALVTRRDDGTWIFLFERLEAGENASGLVR